MLFLLYSGYTASIDFEYLFIMKFSALLFAFLGFCAGVEAAKAKPNIVFIFTDDQDLWHSSLATQSTVQNHLVAKGTTFTNHYATVSVCCPSRVLLMRGQAAHNINNTDISAPGLVSLPD